MTRPVTTTPLLLSCDGSRTKHHMQHPNPNVDPAACKKMRCSGTEYDFGVLFESGFESGAPISRRTKQHQALIMAMASKGDEPMGTASVASCLALVIPLISDEAVKAKLISFLGFQNAEELLSLKDPFRALTALLSPKAELALKESANGDACRRLWKALGAECIHLQDNLEDQLNEMLKKAWETNENVFKPFQIVPEGQAKDLIAALVSMEKIKVSWQTELDNYMHREFTTSTGETVFAKFCIDTEPRVMSSLHFEGGEAVMLPCKPDEKTGKERAMIFVLPPEDDQDLNRCLQALAAHADKSSKGLVFDGSTKYNFAFPAFDAKRAPVTIKPFLEEYVPEIFDKNAGSMEGTLPQKIIEGMAYIGDVQHGASIKADRKGAVAKAVTVAPVMIYRNLPKSFNCNRPFLSILATLKPGATEVDNIEFVTKHETAKTLDMTVS